MLEMPPYSGKTIKLRSYYVRPIRKNQSQSLQAFRMALSKAYFPLFPFHMKMEAGRPPKYYLHFSLNRLKVFKILVTIMAINI